LSILSEGYHRLSDDHRLHHTAEGLSMKIILWIIAIIFIVGLLTLTGVFKLIF